MGSSEDFSERDLIEPARRDARRLASVLGRSVPAPSTFPGCDVIREVHRGGQGVVYEAVQRSTKRTVAIKILHERILANPRTRARFEREVQLLGQFRHPNIVAIHDSGTTDERFYYVMDYIAGQPLDRFLDHRRNSVREILEVFVKVCEAVSAAHLRGVIHRDLKPSNIRVDADGEPIVLDFGLAKVTAEDEEDPSAPPDMTETGQFVGSLPWASPEQVEGRTQDIDVRSDVYSLGVVLYRLLTGVFPYQVSGPPRTVIENILNTSPVSPRTLNKAIGDEVETIVLKCLSKDRERRYQSAGELARDIRRYLAGEPIEAKRDSSWYLLRKTVRRHQALASVTALIVVLITLASVVSTALWQRADRKRNEAEQFRDVLRMALGSINPESARGRDTTVPREVMAEAERLVETELVDQPQVEAALRSMIGDVYLRIGDETRAEVQLKAALNLWQREVGAEHLEALQAMRSLAALFRDRRKYSEAEPLRRQVLEGYARMFGPEAPQTLRAAAELADVLAAKGEYQKAEDLYHDTLERQRRNLGAWHSDTLATMSDLARLLSAIGRDDEALPLKAEVLEGHRRFAGEDALETLEAQVNYGVTLRRQGKLDLAEMQLREALDGMRHYLGDEHPDVPTVMIHVAAVYGAQQRYEEAEAVFREVVDISARVFGRTDRRTIVRMGHLATALHRVGKSDEAEQLLREIATNPRPDGWVKKVELSLLLLEQGRDEEAEPFLMEALEEACQCAGSSRASARMGEMNVLGETLVREGYLGQAEQLYREILRHQGDADHPPRRHLARTLRGLGDALSKQGHGTDAEPLFTRAEEYLLAELDEVKDADGEECAAGQEIIDELTTVYDSWGKPDQAEEYRAMLPSSAASAKD